MSRSQCLLLRRHVKKRDTGTRRVSSHVGPAPHTARARACTSSNAARERSRVRTLRSAFLKLQLSIPSVPPDTKLSKLDVLLLATDYIQHLTRRLHSTAQTSSCSADHNTTATSGRRSGRSAEQRSTCQLPREEMTQVQGLETGRVHRSDSPTLGSLHDETQEGEGCRQAGDSMRRQARHPVKKWPMRSRLYECILSDTPPSRTDGNDNDFMTNTSSKDV